VPTKTFAEQPVPIFTQCFQIDPFGRTLSRASDASGGARRNPEAKRLMYELSAIGNNLNQLARVANTVHAAPQEHELKAMIEILKAAMARVLAL
jgi:hypothetical protein